MGDGFLGGLGTILGGFNTARRIDEEGFDFREQERQREFLRQRQEELARQADADRAAKIGAEVSLGTLEGEEPDFGDLARGMDQGIFRHRVAGKVRTTKPYIKTLEADLRRREGAARHGERLDLLDETFDEREALARAEEAIRAGQQPSPRDLAVLAERERRTNVMRDRGVGGFGGAGAGLTPEGLNAAARQYAATGQMPSLGMGAAGTRQAIINRAAELFPNVDIAGNAARYRAGTGALTNITKQRTAVEAFEDTASRNSEILKDALENIPDLGLTPLNQLARAVASGTGDVNMARANAALQSVRNEYARIISNPNLVGVMSDTARREGEVLLNPNATVDQILGALDVLQAEARNRRESFGAVESELLGSFGAGDTAPVGASGSGTADDPFVFPR